MAMYECMSSGEIPKVTDFNYYEIKGSQYGNWFTAGQTYTAVARSGEIVKRQFVILLHNNTGSTGSNYYMRVKKNGIEIGYTTAYKSYELCWITTDVVEGDIITVESNLYAANALWRMVELVWSNTV